MSDEVAWCEIENGEYTADLDLWSSLCGGGSRAPASGARSVLELGAGVGRVALRLAALGMEVWALERERDLVEEIARRARAGGLESVTPICADARSYAGREHRFDLVIAPQAFLQLFEARADRVAIMACAARHLAQGGGSFWMTYHPDLGGAWGDEGDDPLPPRTTELDGRSFELEPLESYWHAGEAGRSLRIVWLRRVDGDEGTARTCYAELSQAGLEAEASEAGLKLADSIALPGNGHFLDQVAVRFIASVA